MALLAKFRKKFRANLNFSLRKKAFRGKRTSNRGIMTLIFLNSVRLMGKGGFKVEQVAIGHGVKGLILKGEEVLVLLKQNDALDLPGGRVEKGERPKEALVREVFEELGGVEIEIIGLLVPWSFMKEIKLIRGTTWLCSFVTGDISLSPEHSGCGWKTLDQLKNMDIYQKYGLNKRNLYQVLERRKNGFHSSRIITGSHREGSGQT